MARIKQGQAGPFNIGDDIISTLGLAGVALKIGIESNIDAEFKATPSTGDPFILRVGRTGMYESDDFVRLTSLVYSNEGSYKVKKPMFDYVIGEE